MFEAFSTVAQMVCALALLLIAGHLGNIFHRLGKLELDLKELCDRIWDLRK